MYTPCYCLSYDSERVANAPADLPLYRLIIANATEAAQQISCEQEIAGAGTFAVAMIARYQANIATKPWQYRQLFWEAGMIGQILYLEGIHIN
jgi:hypothetical protein